MAVNALSAARSLCEMRGWKLSNLELQKILYLAQMYHLGWIGEPLIDDIFEAWDYGPVSPQVYARIRGFGANPVPNVFHWVQPVDPSTPEYASLKAAADGTRSMDAGQLVNMTHWVKGAWSNCYRQGVRGIKIPNNAILDEYRARVSAAT